MFLLLNATTSLAQNSVAVLGVALPATTVLLPAYYPQQSTSAGLFIMPFGCNRREPTYLFMPANDCEKHPHQGFDLPAPQA